MNQELLSVKNLTKYFPVYSGLLRRQAGEIKAVDGVDFTLHDGEVLGIVGESGSGKSTLGRTAIRLIEPTKGEILFRGGALTAYSKQDLKAFRKEMQIVFQDPYSSLNPRKTILDNIGEALIYHKIVNNVKEQAEEVSEILKKIGMPADSMHRYPHQFSGGQQQRICIGRAIALKPRLIVCDEAASGLDVSIQAQIINLLIELRETMKLSYLFISHDLAIIRHLSDSILVMFKGKVVERGSAQEIFLNPRDPYTKKLLAAIPAEHPKKRRRGI